MNEAPLYYLVTSAEGYIFTSIGEVLVSVGAAVVLLALRRYRDSAVLPRLPRPVLLAFGAVPALACFGLGKVNEHVAFCMLAACGALLSWCYLLCVDLYSRFESREVVVYVLLSYAVSSVLRIPLELLPLPVLCVLSIPLPLLCSVMCARGRDVAENFSKGATSGKKRQRPEESGSLVPYVLVVAAFGLTSGSCWIGVRSTAFEVGVTLAMNAFQAILPLVLLAILLRVRQSVNVVYVCQLAFLLMFSLVLLVTNMGTVNADVASVASYFARYFIRMLLITTLSLLALKKDGDSLIAFGFSYGVLLASMSAGIAFGQSPAFGSIVSAGILSPVMLILVLAVTLVMSVSMYRQHDLLLLLSPATTHEILQRSDYISERCGILAEKYGLTNREREVMQLICVGRSKSYIAEHLILSENTIRSYSKQMYRKLGIHSKQELLDLVEM